MGGIVFDEPITAGTVLVREAIQSQNYAAGSSGWTVNADGNAEFNDLTVRGTFQGQNFVINDDGIFLYSGVPALGNMSGSWAPAAGADSYGNAYPAGIKLYSALGTILLDSTDGVFTSAGGNGSTINIQDGQISFQEPTDFTNSLIIENLAETNGSLFLQSGGSAAASLATLLHIVSTAGAATPGNQDTYPRIGVSAIGGSVANVYTSGTVFKASADGQTSEKWQTPGVIANWSNISMKYRLDPLDQVTWAGRVDYTGAGLAGPGSATILSAVAAAKFRPVANRNPGGVAQYTSGGAFKAPASLAVRTDGNISILYGPGGVATGDRFEFYISVPLGNTA